MIRLDPNIAMKQLTSSQWDAYLDADAKHALQTEARVGIAGLDAEARRREAEAERLRKKVEATNQQMVELFHEIADGADGVEIEPSRDRRGSKEHWIKMIEAQNKEHHEAPIKKIPVSLWIRCNRSAKERSRRRRRLKTCSRRARSVDQGLTWEDTKQLRQEFVDMRTPRARNSGNRLTPSSPVRKPLIDKSNPMMGKIDPHRGHKYYEYLEMVQTKIAEYKRDGKDPRTLLDPKSPEFLGSPEIVNQYRPTLQDSAKWLADDMARGREAKPPTQTDRRNSSTGLKPFKSEPAKPEAKPEAKPVPQSSPVPKQSTQEMRSAIADLEKAVKTMPGVEAIIVGLETRRNTGAISQAME